MNDREVRLAAGGALRLRVAREEDDTPLRILVGAGRRHFPETRFVSEHTAGWLVLRLRDAEALGWSLLEMVEEVQTAGGTDAP